MTEVLAVDDLEDAAVLHAAFDVLQTDGRITMRALCNVLHWNTRRYAELKACFAKWNMSTWENGDNGDDSTDHTG